MKQYFIDIYIRKIKMPVATTAEDAEKIKLQREESKRQQRDLGCIAVTLSGIGSTISGLLGLISGVTIPFIISSSVSGAVGLAGTACCINGYRRDTEEQDNTQDRNQRSPTRQGSFSNRETIRMEVKPADHQQSHMK